MQKNKRPVSRKGELSCLAISRLHKKNVMEPISKIAEKLDIHPEELEQYGHYKAKISLDVLKRLEKETQWEIGPGNGHHAHPCWGR